MQKMQFVLQQLINRRDLSADEMTEIMQLIMQGKATAAQISGFLVALHMKGESVTELAAAATVIRELSIPVKTEVNNLVDIVGTGGDHSKLFNVSTTSAFVMAAAGAKVAKHNNRAISSQSGSADVLEIATINAFLEPDQIATCIEKLGISFMFAPKHHLAWQQVSAARRELGVRTLFNLLGPLANPANAPNLLVGVYSKHWVEIFAQVFCELGNQHVLVVHSEDGLDEISIAAPTFVAELKNGLVNTYNIRPEDFGIRTQLLETLRVNTAAESYALMQSVLDNMPGSARDIVCLNAGAGLYAANFVDSIAEGVDIASATIASGAVKAKFIAYTALSRSFIL